MGVTENPVDGFCVTDCHHLPMFPIVPQSAPMVSVDDVLVKL